MKNNLLVFGFVLLNILLLNFDIMNSRLWASNANTMGFLFSDTLITDVILDSASSPWQIENNIIVRDGITLTIEAGTVVYFDDAVSIEILAGGKFIADGSEQKHILLTRKANSNSRWNGIRFRQSKQDNRIRYVDMEYADRSSYWLLVDYSKLFIEHTTWTSSNKTIIEVNHPQLLVRNSIFPETSEVEVVHGQSLVDDEYLVLDGNEFHKTTGYNDIIDFSDCERPGPIFEVYKNTFYGGGDDGLDLDGCDAHIEGNTFMDFHKDNTTSSTSNAIATGFQYNKSTYIVVVRNIFINNDHAVVLKEDCYMYAENNVFVGCTKSCVNFSEWPDRTVTPGKGAYFDGNIFWNNNQLFENEFAQPGNPDPVIEINRSIIPADHHHLGVGNLDVNPQFIDDENDFHLQANSQAIGAGPNGLDMGVYVSAGASIFGEPPEVTDMNSAELIIGGPGIISYKYSINSPDGIWSEEYFITENPKIVLTDLLDGENYTVYVMGKNSAGTWQRNPDYAISKTWRIDLSGSNMDEIGQSKPNEFQLMQNIPNPFNNRTIIRFSLPQAGHVNLKIFDLQGREITTLISDFKYEGAHTIAWRANNVASGVYFYQIQFGGHTISKKMILLQ